MTTRRLSRDDLIEALHTLAERVGRTPIEYDTYDYPDIPSHTIFVKRFGTWREALQAAGIPLNPHNMGYDPEDLLEHLRSVAESLGRTPTQAELRETGGPHPATYRAHFGSWKAALAEVDLEPRFGRRYETAQLLQLLRELAEELGRTRTITELQARDDLPSPYTYRDRFGQWNEALRQAELTPRHLIAIRDSRPAHSHRRGEKRGLGCPDWSAGRRTQGDKGLRRTERSGKAVKWLLPSALAEKLPIERCPMTSATPTKQTGQQREPLRKSRESGVLVLE